MKPTPRTIPSDHGRHCPRRFVLYERLGGPPFNEYSTPRKRRDEAIISPVQQRHKRAAVSHPATQPRVPTYSYCDRLRFHEIVDRTEEVTSVHHTVESAEQTRHSRVAWIWVAASPFRFGATRSSRGSAKPHINAAARRCVKKETPASRRAAVPRTATRRSKN